MGVVRTGLTKTVGLSNAQFIGGSLRFDSGSSQYLSRTPGSAGSRKTWTWAGWVKLCSIPGSYVLLFSAGTGGSDSALIRLNYESSGKLNLASWNTDPIVRTASIYRDFSAWYHIVVAVDTANATTSNIAKIYVNGTEATYDSDNRSSFSNVDTAWNNNVAQTIGTGSWSGGSGLYANAYFANVYNIDGQALNPSYFGFTDPLTNTWRPKKLSSSIAFGTNGFYLPLDGAGDSIGSNTNVGKDKSGRGNDWTLNNFSPTFSEPNILPDSPSGISFSTAPTSGIGTITGMTKPNNYCTWNPLLNNGSTASTLSNGNLNVTTATTGGGLTVGTIGVSSKKWYWELTVTSVGANPQCGVLSVDANINNSYPEAYYGNTRGYVVNLLGNEKFSPSQSPYGSGGLSNNDVIGVALDLDAGTLVFYVNGSSRGTAFTGISGTFTPVVGDGVNNGGSTFIANFGQKPFKYTPPSGFLPLCTANLPRPTIARPDQYVGIVTYTGNGSTQSINIGFKPDLVWVKNRNGANNNVLQDSVRGFGSTKNLSSNQTHGEDVDTDGVITGVTNTGFNVAINAGNGNGTNRTNYTYVGWAWKAGGSGGGLSFWKDDVGYSTASAAGLTAGTITPSGASINTKSGFSIITWTGNQAVATIPHGLGKKPSLVIVKGRNATTDWMVIHPGTTATKYIYLNTAGASVTYSGFWNDTEPTDTVFTTGSDGIFTTSGRTFVAYLWAEIPGFSKFGTYTGNGSTDGPMVVTGFKPKWLLIKSSSAAGESWILEDIVRDTYNPASKWVYTNYSDAESNGLNIDFLSNGFKPRISGTSVNTSSATYIYAAFAETPSFNLYGGQSNAR